MIQLIKSANPPDILKNNQGTWTQALLDATLHYGSYEKIPAVEKKQLLDHYRHADIQTALRESSNNKCAFCETLPLESGNIEVEHFAPKSLYPSLAFDWDNLLPVCRKCNEKKRVHDTVTLPILNPYKHNPEQYLTYMTMSIIIMPTELDPILAERSINICGLDATRLNRARADILIAFMDYEKELRRFMEEYSVFKTQKKKQEIITLLSNSLEKIELLCLPNSKLAGYCRHLVRHSDIYQEARKFVDDYIREVV